MKAVGYHRYGPPDVLRIEERPVPTPGPNELLIRVRAAEVTKSDTELRKFEFPVKWFWLPLRLAFGLRRPRRAVLGGYFAGEVEAVGEGVTRFAPGAAIFGATQLRLGAYGQYVCLPDTYTLAPKPARMSFEAAAAVPLGGLNALHFLRRAQLKAGETVLVNGAGGSIGAHAVQIAKAMGGEVTAVDAGFKEPFLRRLGADHFIDYHTRDFTAGGAQYDVILNMVADSAYGRCLRALRPGGRYVLGNPRVSDMLRSVFTNAFQDKRVIFAFAQETQEELETLRDMIDAGQIASILDRVFAADAAAEAHRLVETEQRIGAIVLSH